uniref:THAP domain-containing protein 1 n=1 Tax=Seriola lalandi dorsalis TaxID=1841481 RepID=A0A3B4XAE7_SERLL
MLCVCVYVCLCVCVKTVCTQSHPYLSFHDFPSDDQLRASWVTAIRREEGATFKILRGSTYVCSLHFNNDDIYCTPKGFRRIKRGAVPSKFAWNDLPNYKVLKLSKCTKIIFHEQAYTRFYACGDFCATFPIL